MHSFTLVWLRPRLDFVFSTTTWAVLRCRSIVWSIFHISKHRSICHFTHVMVKHCHARAHKKTNHLLPAFSTRVSTNLIILVNFFATYFFFLFTVDLLLFIPRLYPWRFSTLSNGPIYAVPCTTTFPLNYPRPPALDLLLTIWVA
jgi:hypothetical protein